MKIAVPGDSLKAALSRAVQVTDRKMVIPILSSVHIEATDDAVRLTATDMDITMIVRVDGAVTHEAGIMCLPASELLKMATLAKKATVEISSGKAFATAAVSWGRAGAELRTYEPGDFPMPTRDGYDLKPVDGGLLAAAIKYVFPAVDDSETRPYLCGVYLEDGEDGDAVAVGTDGHRMHIATMPGVSLGGSAIIPARSAQLVGGILAETGDARFHLSANRWGIEAGGVLAWGRNIDGSYPTWRRVLTGDPVEVAIVARDALRDGIEVAQTGMDKGHNGPVVVVDAAGGEMTIRGLKPGVQLAKAASTTFDCEGRSPLLTAVNGDYLRDLLGVTPGDRVALLSVGERVEIEPVEQQPMLRLRGVCMATRASAAEMGRAA